MPLRQSLPQPRASVWPLGSARLQVAQLRDAPVRIARSEFERLTAFATGVAGFLQDREPGRIELPVIDHRRDLDVRSATLLIGESAVTTTPMPRGAPTVAAIAITGDPFALCAIAAVPDSPTSILSDTSAY